MVSLKRLFKYILHLLAFSWIFSRHPGGVRPLQTSEPACGVSVHPLHWVSCAKIWTFRPGQGVHCGHAFIHGGWWRWIQNDQGGITEAQHRWAEELFLKIHYSREAATLVQTDKKWREIKNDPNLLPDTPSFEPFAMQSPILLIKNISCLLV